MFGRISTLILCLALMEGAAACGSNDSGNATDNELHCSAGSVIGRESPTLGEDGAPTPEGAVEAALLNGEKAVSVPSDPAPDAETVTVVARADDGPTTAEFKTWNPEGRGWFLVESKRCSD